MQSVKSFTLMLSFCTCFLMASFCFAGDVLLQDFETQSAFMNPRVDSLDLSKKNASSASLNEQWATCGKKSLQLSFLKYADGQPEWPGISLFYANGNFKVKDWSNYGQFALDIKNECPYKVRLAVEFRSANKNGYTQTCFIEPNATETLKIDIQRAWKKSIYPVDMKNISEIIIYSTRPEAEWKYSIDNMRLIDNREKLELLTKTNWGDIAINYLHEPKVREEFRKQLDEIRAAAQGNSTASAASLNTKFRYLMKEILAARYRSEWFFNFGPENTLQKESEWKNVSPSCEFSDKHGYGWADKTALAAKTFESQNKWGFRKGVSYIQYKEAPPIFLNEQQAGYVYSKSPASFRIALPNGDYKVMLIEGYPGEAADRICPIDMTANIQGTPHRITLAERKIFKTPIFDFSVKNRMLDMTFSSNIEGRIWLVNAIAIWPASENNRAFDEVVTPLRDHINIMPEQERAEWTDTRVKPAPRENIPETFHDFGFAPFRVEELADYPMSFTPKTYGMETGLQIFTAKNEIATTTFGLLALENAANSVRINAGELKGKNGSIPASAVRVRIIENIPWPLDDAMRREIIEFPKLLQDAYEGVWQWRPWQARVFYLTVKLPQGTAAGEYAGVLNVSTGDRKAMSIPLKLDVLPVTLHNNPKLNYGAYWYWYEEKNAARVRSEFRNMIDHGFNMVGPWRPNVRDEVRNGKMVWTMGQPTETMEMIKEFGLMRPVPYCLESSIRSAMKKLHNVEPQKGAVDVPVPAKFYDNVTQLVAEVSRWQKANGFPELYYYPMDEISDYKLAYKLGVAIKKVPGAKFFSNSNPIIQKHLGSLVDVGCLSYNGYISEDKLHEYIVERPKTAAWTYPNATLNARKVAARMLWGLSGRKIGFEGLWPWAYMSPAGSPNSAFDGLYPDYMCAYPELDTPVDTVQYEEIRRGIDDGRYYDTAIALMEKLRATNAQQNIVLADNAEKELQKIMSEVPFTYLDEKSMQLGREKVPQLRGRLQDIVVRLNNALDSKEKTDVAK